MRYIILLTAFIINANIILGQNWLCENYNINFEDTFCLNQLTIDTMVNSNNIWQIGNPQKIVFNSAFSLPKAIVTDTINPYPINDTSSFTVMNSATGGGFQWPHTVILGGYFKVNTDSLNDFGLIEFSPDNGEFWIDLINDTIYNSYYFWAWPGPPTLTGNSNGWKEFRVHLAELGPIFNIQIGDTFLYRLTFISDSISDTLDGLMYDDLLFMDFVEGINDFNQKNINSRAFPNPASNMLTIDFENPDFSLFQLTIYDHLGKQIFLQERISNNEINIDTEGFKNGIYHYKLLDTKKLNKSTGKFIINK